MYPITCREPSQRMWIDEATPSMRLVSSWLKFTISPMVLFCLPEGLRRSDFRKTALDSVPLMLAPMVVARSKYWFSTQVLVVRVSSRRQARTKPLLERNCLEKGLATWPLESTCRSSRAMRSEGMNCTEVLISLRRPETRNSRRYIRSRTRVTGEAQKDRRIEPEEGATSDRLSRRSSSRNRSSYTREVVAVRRFSGSSQRSATPISCWFPRRSSLSTQLKVRRCGKLGRGISWRRSVVGAESSTSSRAVACCRSEVEIPATEEEQAKHMVVLGMARRRTRAARVIAEGEEGGSGVQALDQPSAIGDQSSGSPGHSSRPPRPRPVLAELELSIS